MTQSLQKLPNAPFSGAGLSSISEYITNKEKRVGAVVTIILGAALVFGLGPIALPFIVKTLALISTSFSYAIAIAIKSAIAVGLIWVLAQKKTRNIGRTIYSMLARKASMALIRINPVERAECYANEYLPRRKAVMVDKATKVKAVRMGRDRDVESTQRELDTAFGQMQALKSRYYENNRWTNDEKRGLFQKLSLEHQLRSKSLEGFVTQQKVLVAREEFLKKAIRAYELYISIIQMIVEVKTKDYIASKATAEAIGEFDAVTSGVAHEQQDFKLTLEYLDSEIHSSEAKVEMFLETKPEAIGLYELEADVAEDRMLLELSRMETLSAEVEEGIGRVENAQRLLTEGGTAAFVEIAAAERRPEPLLVGLDHTNR